MERSEEKNESFEVDRTVREMRKIRGVWKNTTLVRRGRRVGAKWI